MSLNAALSSSLTGLVVAQHALGVTSNNIANVNTDGFTRKQVNQTSLIVAGVGHGAATEETTRIADEFLNGELRRQLNGLGRTEQIADVYARIESAIFGTPGEADRGLEPRYSALLASLEELANSPESTPSRTALLNAVEDMLNQLSRDALSIQQIREDTDRKIGTSIDSINNIIEELHELNIELIRAIPSAELMDRRDTLLEELSTKIDVSTFKFDNNAIGVYTTGGEPLLEYTPRKLIYQPSSAVGNDTLFGAIEIFDQDQLDPATGNPLPAEIGRTLVTSGVRMDLTPELLADTIPDADQQILSPLVGGELQGLLEARDRILPGLADQIDELALMVSHTLNSAHNNAVPSPKPTDFIGSRQGLNDYDGAARSGFAYITVVDSTGAIAVDVTVDVGAAATPEALAAQINAQLGATGTATINALNDNLEINLGLDGGGNPYRMALSEGDSAMTFSDSAGRTRDYGFAHYFGLNNLVEQTGNLATELSLRSDIAADSSLLSNVFLDRSGIPPTIGGAGDNRGFQGLADAMDSALNTIARGGIPAKSTTISQYLSDIVALHGNEAAQASSRESADRVLVDDLQFRQGTVSGVNLDEELSKLMIYQRAYTVSAQVMAVTNDLFDDLLSIAR